MKIAFDAKRALNNSSGLGNYSRNLLDALMQNFPNEEYLLFSPEAKDDFFNQLNGDFKIVFPETKFQKLFPAIWRSSGVKKDMQKQRVDIYHGLSNEVPFGISNSGVGTIATIHDLIFLKHKEQYPFVDRQVYEYKTRYAAKHADKIIAVSNETKKDLIEMYEVKEEKIEVIYPVINSNYELQITNREVAVKYNLPKKYILNVSSFFPRKNHEVLIAAFNLIKSKVEEDLVLVGNSGTEKERLKFYLEKMNLQHRAKIITGVANQDLPAIYQRANAFVFPSLYEGFGMPIVEASLSKVPVIATKGGCFEEAGGKSSLYINPNSAEEIANAILKVLSNEQLKNEIIQSGFLHAQTMTGKIIAEKTMKVYTEVAR